MSTEIFRTDYATPHHSTPFSKIPVACYEPAMRQAMEKSMAEIEAIASNPEPPTFANTIDAYERSGAMLDRVLNAFYPLLSACSTPQMEEIAERMSGPLSEHSTRILLNERLFERVRSVYDSRESLTLTTEESTVLRDVYEGFSRNGALLRGADRERFAELRAELSQLTTRFGNNVQRAMNSARMLLRDIAELDGLPERDIQAARHAAEEAGEPGAYAITLHFPSYSAFMRHATRRDLRERLWRLYNARCTEGELSNVDTVKRIAVLRLELARLLGHPTFAHYKLERTMAGTPQRVNDMLRSLAHDYHPVMEAELKELREFSGLSDFAPWDYSFYSNALRRTRLGYDIEAMRPYFNIDAVISGVFGLATTLYGITFRPARGVEVYHPDVKAFEVTDSDGSYLGLLYTDFYPRPGKRPGAWMTELRPQSIEPDGTDSRPHISLVMNFTRPVGDTPSLLTPDEVNTFLHEFGHALHGLFARTHYASHSGTAVYRDFVELPSQLMENFLTARPFLDTFARHYLTGEPLPQEFLDQMIADRRFGAGYACCRQLSFGYLDMAWHSICAPVDDAASFENAAIEPVKAFAPEAGAMVSPQFGHIFSGGYAAGYYSYKWAEMLDADAFELFSANGVTDRATAQAFRREILEKGGTEDPVVLYRRFRGADPDPRALLRRDGLA